MEWKLLTKEISAQHYGLQVVGGPCQENIKIVNKNYICHFWYEFLFQRMEKLC